METASKEDILGYLSSVLKCKGDMFKPSEKFKAAELLGKYYGLFGDKSDKEVGDVIIVDNIPEGKDGTPS